MATEGEGEGRGDSSPRASDDCGVRRSHRVLAGYWGTAALQDREGVRGDLRGRR